MHKHQEELDKLDTWTAMREFIRIVIADRTLKAKLLSLVSVLYFYLPWLVMAIWDRSNETVNMQAQPNSYQLLWALPFVLLPFSQYMTAVLELNEMWSDHSHNLKLLEAHYEVDMHRRTVAESDPLTARDCIPNDQTVSYVKAVRRQIELFDEPGTLFGLEVSRSFIANVLVFNVGICLFLLAPQMLKLVTEITTLTF